MPRNQHRFGAAAPHCGELLRTAQPLGIQHGEAAVPTTDRK
jgi:hypothetical protein